MASIPHKRCARCGETKPFTDFPKNRCKPDGYSATCKACRSVYVREYRLKNTDRFARYREQQVSTNREGIRASGARSYLRNRDKIRAKHAEWQRNNPDKRRASAARLRDRHRERLRVYSREVKKREYAANPGKFIDRVNRWQKDNPNALRAIRNRRKARKMGNGGSFTAQEWQDMKAHYDYRCLCCGKQEPEIVLTVDHVIPLSRGGTNDISNIQPLCGPCNTRKFTSDHDYR